MNTVTLTIKDENTSVSVFNEFSISVLLEDKSIKARDLIKARISAEVENYNKQKPEYFNGLVQPTDAERTLNGYKLKTKKMINLNEQYVTALDAFERNGYIMLVNCKQVESLDEDVLVDKFSTINFIKLVPLKGG
ncbi:MAG: hypothetical protein A2Y62_01955 [Candidatus Fischerbacteria bacterium RBG_13_37_8]|uniref:Uncharacterized protein n=1 Tax=Candidatus Fischerbacteria bacterium RBG_13_37_8 TaxID=1817863 RepID=A0A1F5VJP9_9BACT|nr:MAG: hypothetical protein A2Y62_01955 [Candidatus Fischerbacteria bacterium RBG_13_37_8]